MLSKCVNVQMCECANGRLKLQRLGMSFMTFNHLHIFLFAHFPICTLTKFPWFYSSRHCGPAKAHYAKERFAKDATAHFACA